MVLSIHNTFSLETLTQMLEQWGHSFLCSCVACTIPFFPSGLNSNITVLLLWRGSLLQGHSVRVVHQCIIEVLSVFPQF